MKWGVDISKWNGDFDLKGSGAQFVIIKAGGSDDGTYIDSRFLDNYTKAKNLGIPCGIYWYTRAFSVANLKAEIDYLMENIKGLSFELPIFLDLEESVIYQIADSLALAWLSELSARGYYPGVYASLSWWQDVLKKVTMTSDQKWVALWVNDSDPGYDCGIWQNGISNGVDSDFMFADYSFIKEEGLNNMEKIYFSDVPATRKDYKAIQWAANNGYIKGYSDGSFKPDEPLTRGQLCIVLKRIIENGN